MTKIKFFKNNLGYEKLEALNHTGYGECGKDVLCAAISAITQSLALGLKKVVKVKFNYKINEIDGYILIELPKKIDESKREKSNLLFETAFVSLKDLESGYSNYLKLEVIDNVY